MTEKEKLIGKDGTVYAVGKDRLSVMGVDSEAYYQDWEEEYEDDEDYVPVVDQAAEFTKIGIVSAHDLSYVAVDLNDSNKTYGALFSGVSGDTFSWDVSVHPDARGMGVASDLIDAAIEEYEGWRNVYDDLSMKVHVVNPVLVKHLERKGFKIVEESRGEFLMEFQDD